MTRNERALLLGVSEEVVLHLRSRLAEIESLHPREASLAIATFQDRLRRIEQLINDVKKEGNYAV